MKRNAIETILGAVVIIIALVFLVFTYQTADVGSASGYEVNADFSGIGGLAIGDQVQLSGVKVGTVTKITLLDDSYLARVTMDIDPAIKLPSDSVALISSTSLLGGRYMALEPGAEEDIIPDGGRIQYTQAPQNLEQLLGQFIFSMKDAKDAKGAEATTAAAETSAPAMPMAAPATLKVDEADQADEAQDTAAEAPAAEATPDAAAPAENDHP